jgi:hypothetical protein
VKHILDYDEGSPGETSLAHPSAQPSPEREGGPATGDADPSPASSSATCEDGLCRSEFTWRWRPRTPSAARYLSWMEVQMLWERRVDDLRRSRP